jgi:O-antigen/teichoic acid export membrane protein
MLSYGRWIYLSSILGLMAVQLIIFLLSTLSGLYETGLYTAVVGPANLLLLFGTPLVTVLSSRATRRMGDANFAGQVAASLRLIFYVTVALAVLSLLVAPLLIPWIFGAGFTGAVLPFRILLPGIVAVALKAVMDEYLVGSGQPHRVIMISATTAILTLTLGLLLLPDHGATGAATAVTSARLGSTLVAVHAFLRVSGLRLKQLCKPRRSDWYPLGLVLGFLGLHRSRAP